MLGTEDRMMVPYSLLLDLV